MKTPVEWLFEQLWDTPKGKFDWYLLKAQALKMEKEQIIQAWKSGVDYRDNNGHGSTYLEIELGEQPNNYYNETFKEDR